MCMFIQEDRPSSAPSQWEGEGSQDKPRLNAVQRLPDWRTTLPLAQSSPRCGARTRNGNPCRSAAMANGRCRMHGGASTGPRTAEGLARIKKARTVHGRYSAEMVELRGLMRDLKDMTQAMIEEV